MAENHGMLESELCLDHKGFELPLTALEIPGLCCEVLDGFYWSDRTADDAQSLPRELGYTHGSTIL